jgi:hypothetical protein
MYCQNTRGALNIFSTDLPYITPSGVTTATLLFGLVPVR